MKNFKLFFTSLLLLSITLFQPINAQTAVTWTNLNDVAASGSSLTKTSTTGWNCAGASSIDILPVGKDGYFEFSYTTNGTPYFFGVSDIDTDGCYGSIDYAMYSSGTFLYPYVNGVATGASFNVIPFGSSVKLRIQRSANELIFTADVAPSFSHTITATTGVLKADVTLYELNSSIDDCSIYCPEGDSDWFVQNTTNSPTDINQNIYTFGSVGINTTAPQNRLHVANNGWGGSIDLKVDGRIETGNHSQMGGVWLDENHTMFVGQHNQDEYGFWSSGRGWNTLNIDRNTGNVGIGVPANSGGIGPSGNLARLAVGGDIWANGSWYLSDKRYKRKIANLSSALDRVLSMNGYSYEYRQEEFPDHNFSNGRTIGFLAQELEEVSPELVQQTKDGYYSVNYSGVIPILTEAIKEQQAIIENHSMETSELKAEIAELKAAVQSICNGGCGGLGGLSNSTSTEGIAYTEEIKLEQNAPNPFNAVTTIEYFLPKEVKSAALIVYDLQGKQLKNYELTETGKGVVEIDAGDLVGGMYLYSLLVDGKPFSTLKMILTE